MENIKEIYRNRIHRMVDTIDNEEYLQRIYSFTLVKYEKETKGDLQHE